MASADVCRAEWHELQIDDVGQRLGTTASRGLQPDEAARRRIAFGPNEIHAAARHRTIGILARQFRSALVGLLTFAGIAALLLGDLKDAIAIAVMIALNAALGFRQEHRAEAAIEALKKLSVPEATVRRGGVLTDIPATDIVPGDIVVLSAGMVVPADVRLISSYSIRTQESALTGESQPVDKTSAAMGANSTPLPARSNMVYAGTAIVAGRGEGIVIATGSTTEIGRIAGLLAQVPNRPTPLQRQVARLGRMLAVAAILLGGAIFLVGLWRGVELRTLLLTSVSLAVAAAPEGLPAVITVALALGSSRMLKRNALVRKLNAVETLGSVSVICADKTGTLTQNRLAATIAVAGGHTFDLRFQPADNPDLTMLLTAAALCNDATLQGRTAGAEECWQGDPTEIALAQAAHRRGLVRTALEQAFVRVAEIPFDPDRKRMTTLHDLSTVQYGNVVGPGKYVAFTKGAIDCLLPSCHFTWTQGGIAPLSQELRERILSTADRYARNGGRVLGVAFRITNQIPSPIDQLEQRLVYLGIIAMEDPLREEAVDAVMECRQAGIRPVMISGDHPLTAQHIAATLGLDATRVITGSEIDAVPSEQMDKAVLEASVYARVTPQQKLSIVGALQRAGHIVAMTGDGVNDAPALRKADIGVSMGRDGTEVAREAADIVLRDDNFATIVAAVREGRVIHDNVRKFIRYILACNSAELWVMLAAPALGMPLPLLPLQILWMNFVTDGLPAMALTVEPAESDVMARPPRSPETRLVTAKDAFWMLWSGLVMATVVLVTGFAAWSHGDPAWQTLVFTTITISQVLVAMAIRSETRSIFNVGIGSNRALPWSAAIAIVLQLLIAALPAGRSVFQLAPAAWTELGICVAVSAIPLVAIELHKWLLRRRRASSWLKLFRGAV